MADNEAVVDLALSLGVISAADLPSEHINAPGKLAFGIFALWRFTESLHRVWRNQ